MYCKKCGHKQENGEKFCPVCGEPFLDENGKPYLKGIKKDLLDAQKAAASKVSKIADTSQSKASSFSKTILDAFQSGKLGNVASKVKTFLNDKMQTRRWSKIIAIFVVVLFLIFKAGIHASWLWFVLMALILVIPFIKIKPVSEDKQLKINKGVFFLTITLGLIILCFGPNGRRKQHSSISFLKASESPSEIFLSNISSSAYSVTIYETNAFGGWAVSKREVNESDNYDPNLSYVWTIVFFPDNDTHGTAAVVPFTLDKTGYAKAMEISYLYDINGDNINLYNGKTVIRVNPKDDIHLQIEKDGKDRVKLVGHFRGRSREFEKSSFPFDREPHHFAR